MSQLEEIKAREAAPRKVLEWTNVYADEFICAVDDSQADVAKLVAALEAVLAVRDTMYREEGDWANPEAHFARLITEAIEEALS